MTTRGATLLFKEGGTVLRGGDVKDINELKRQGLSISQISSLTGFDRKTIRKYLNDPQTPRYSRAQRVRKGSKLEPFQSYLQERMAAGVWNAVVLLAELKERGYSGCYTTLKDYLHPLRKEAAVVAVRRFETSPGHQAQLDWGELGHIETAQGRRTLYGFAFTLGHSRALFADIATDTKIATLLRLHEAAFAELGGIPREILYDRMKTVVLGTDERGETQWNLQFLDFARHWGFTPRACRAYRPQTKGKVESGIGYLRKNFLCGRVADGIADLRAQMRTWLWQVANQRIHGTTHRHVFAAWQQEKPFLLPLLGRSPYPYAHEEQRRTVSRDAFVSFKGNRYSVPWRVAAQEVLLQERDGQLHIRRGGERLACHLLCPPGAHRLITVAAHHENIPLGDCERSGKTKIILRPPKNDLPVVEVRSLLAYEEALHG
jgi:transposase